MSQLLQVINGVEFWECLNCGRVRRILPREVNTIFIVPPEFCSLRCRREFMKSERRGEYEQRDQMRLLQMPEAS